MSRGWLAVASIVPIVLSAARGNAADHTNLEDGLPVTVTDAYATNYLNREVQALARYQRTKEDANVFMLMPRFEVGFPRNAQISVAMPFLAVTGERFYAGRANVEMLYSLNVETLVLPALAVVGAVDMPTGRDREGAEAPGFDPIVRAYLTKSIPGMMYWNRVHLNASYQFNAAREQGERAGRYTLVAGYSFRLSSAMIGILDYVREQRMEEDKVANIAEVGIRYQVNPLLVIAIGGGIGFAENSPPARGSVSFQYRAF